MSAHHIEPLSRCRTVRIEWDVNHDNDPPTSHILLTFWERGQPELWSGSYEGYWFDETPHSISQADEAKVHAAVEKFEADNPDPVGS